jgi:F-type H+-transporting ATPase subunit b
MTRLALWLLVAFTLSVLALRAGAQEPAEETPAEEPRAADVADEADVPAGKTKSKGKAKAKADDEEHMAEEPASSEDHAGGEHATNEHGTGEHADDHGGHDPYDLSHGNASSQLKAAQELRFDLSIATFLVFLLLLAILAKFAWGPISRGLEQREETIARQIEEARLGAERATQSLQEYEKKLGLATEEARQIVAQARKDAESAKDRIVAEAREAAAKERDRAVADITSAKNQALQEIAQKSVATAVSLAGKIIRREVKPQDHEALIGDALNQFSKLN